MQNSEATPASQNLDLGAPVAGENQQPKLSDLEQVAALLESDGEDSADSEESQRQAEADAKNSDAPEGEKPKPKAAPPKSLDALAESAGIKASDLYKFEIGLPGEEGNKTTLGEMKDAFTSAQNLDLDRLRFEETRSTKEKEFLRSSQELQEIVSMLPKAAISKSLLEAVAARRAETTRREESLTLAAIPSWEDSETETRERTEMGEFMEQYGFPKNYAGSLIHSATLALVRDAMLRERRITKALEQVKTARKPGHRQTPTQPKPRQQPRRRAGGRQSSEVSQVAELLANET